MLYNLKAELVRKGLEPANAIAAALNCTEKTARNKLGNITPVTVPEAVAIQQRYFSLDEYSLEYLFNAEPITPPIPEKHENAI